MIVMKFGGTSVGSPAAFLDAVQLVESAVARDPVVVVSALAGATDLLLEFARRPAARAEIAARLVERHRALAHEVGVPVAALEPPLAAWQGEARAWIEAGAHPDAPDQDRILSFGERLAAELFAAALECRGVPACAVVAGAAGLVADDAFGAAHPLPDAYVTLRATLGRRPPLPVVTGFLGQTLDGETTTLGSGGSDFSAAILGAALGAAEIQIWTDTSGMLSADPRIVPEARPVPRLSFREASELAYFGAKVLHPKTLLPAVERGIPVRILNTQRPDDPGSLVTSETSTAEETWRIKSIACKKGIAAVTVDSTRMFMAYGFLARVFEIFGRHRIVVDLVTTSEVSISLTVDDTSNLLAAVEDLQAVGTISVKPDLAVVAVVGEGAAARLGLAGHVFTLLGGVGIGVEMISLCASRINLSFVVKQDDADRAVRLLHRGLGLDAPSAA